MKMIVRVACTLAGTHTDYCTERTCIMYYVLCAARTVAVAIWNGIREVAQRR